jgi:hypothetical protein
MHGGNIDGFSAMTTFFPTDSIGIVVLVNQSASSVPAIVRNLIADRMLRLKYFDWNTDLKKADDKAKAAAKEGEKTKIPNRKPNTKPSHELKDYTGLYKHNAYGIFEISKLHDSLFLYLGKHVYWLRHYHFDMFEPLEVDPQYGIDTSEKNNTLQFEMNTLGEIDHASFDFEPALKDPIVFAKTQKPKEIGKDSLQKYVGEYDLGGVIAKVSMKNDKTLYLFVPGQPEYELVPIENNKFSIKSLNGFTIQFNLNDKNEVTELLSIQPNGTFKGTRKK